MEKTDNGIKVNGCQSLMVVSKIVKYEHDFSFNQAMDIEKQLQQMNPDFDKLLFSNEAHIKGEMDRFGIHLGNEGDYVLSGEELLERSHSMEELDPTLLEKLYDMGRFFPIERSANRVNMGKYLIHSILSEIIKGFTLGNNITKQSVVLLNLRRMM